MFLEVTMIKQDVDGKKYEEEFLLNTDDITGIRRGKEHTGSLIEVRGKDFVIYVTETYEDIKSWMIREVISKDIGDVVW